MSEDQARDELGRFSSGGGGGGGVKKWAATQGKRTWTDQLPHGMAAETWQNHFDKDPSQGGKPSEERKREVHDPIMNKALVPKPAAADEQKVAIMTMGGPGSGKSSMMRGVDHSKFVTVDPDAVRTQLPEYKAATSGDKIYKGAAAMTHEEASYIAKQTLAKAIENGQHVIVDGTGSNADSMLAKMKQLKDNGYQVHLAYAHLDNVDEALRRVADRAEKTGRTVPEKLVRSAYSSIPKNFPKLARGADSFAVYDTSRKDAPMIWEKKVGQAERHHDAGAVSAFKAKHGG